MNENTTHEEEGSRQPSPISAQEVDHVTVEEAMKRLRIAPRKVLETLDELRIDKSRIKPLASSVPKAGGNADVEAATLLPAQAIHSSEPEGTEYVAIKKLRFDEETDDDRVLAPLVYEVNLLKDLSHDHIVKILGFVEDTKEGIAWMIFSWEKNGNLREFVRSAGWELPERVSLIYDVAKGLSYLHGRNPPICHGDLKSLNILVNTQNRAVITDFGSARPVDFASREASGGEATKNQQPALTEDLTTESLRAEVAATGQFITITGPAWTIRWAAPELLEGELPRLASDIWAFGWVCWEAITGNFPFSEENDIAIVSRIVTGDIPDVSGNARLQQVKALCSLMMDCWRLDATTRPPAIECQQTMTWMDLTIPLRRVGNDLSSNCSSELLFALGRMQLHNRNMDEAQKYTQKSLEVAKSAGDVNGHARALQALGNVYRMRHNCSKAEDLYAEARDIYSRVGNQVGFAQSVMGLGDVYHKQCQYPQAEVAYTEAHGIYSRIGFQPGIAHSMHGLATNHCMQSQYSKAEDAYMEARDIHSRIGNQSGFAQSLMGLGQTYHLRSKYPKAEASYTEAREIYLRIGDQLGFAQSVRGLGDTYHLRGEHSKAAVAYSEARDTYSRIGDELGVAHSVKGLGDVYYLEQEDSKAEVSYTEARDIYSRIGDHRGVAQSARSLGDIYRVQCKNAEAEIAYTEARDICFRIGSQAGFAHAVQGLGLIYSAQGKHPEAEEALMKAREIYTQIGDMSTLASVLWCLGWLTREQDRYDEAECFVREASAIYLELGLEHYVAECRGFLWQIHPSLR